MQRPSVRRVYAPPLWEIGLLTAGILVVIAIIADLRLEYCKNFLD